MEKYTIERDDQGEFTIRYQSGKNDVCVVDLSQKVESCDAMGNASARAAISIFDQLFARLVKRNKSN